MIDDIVKSTQEASTILAGIRKLLTEGSAKESMLQALRKAVNLKLMISEEEETNIRRLVIISIKRQDLQKCNLPDDVVQKEIKKYDCHQTSLVTQKKVLLIMFIERELGITLGDDEAVEIETLDELAQALSRHLKEGA